MTDKWPSRAGINNALQDIAEHWRDFDAAERAQIRTALRCICNDCSTCPACAAAAAEAAALREKASALIQRLAHINVHASEDVAFRAAMKYGTETHALQIVLENPSPAVLRLEQRLAPMPCGHPGACGEQGDDGTVYCLWCADNEKSLDAVYDDHMELLEKELEVAQERAEALAELVPEAQLLEELAARYATPEQEAEARALAARIEEARGERGEESGNV